MDMGRETTVSRPFSIRGMKRGVSLYADKAEILYREGFNCAQAVFVPIAMQYGMDEKAALRVASSLGGGLAASGEVCGAILGMLMAVGLAEGYDTPDQAAKLASSARVKALVEAFQEKFGATGCNELRDPGNRAACMGFVREAADMAAAELKLEG